MRGSSLILGRFTHDSQRILAAVGEFALVHLKRLPNVTLGGGERHIAVFANAELGGLPDQPQSSLSPATTSAAKLHPSTNSATTSCVGPIASPPNAAVSASSTAPTTKSYWWYGYTLTCSSRNICPDSPRPARSFGHIASSRSTTSS